MTPRQQQIAAAPILSTPQEKVAAMSGMVDPMQIPMEEPRDEFRRDIVWLVMGGLTAFWLCVGIAVWNNWQTIQGWFA